MKIVVWALCLLALAGIGGLVATSIMAEKKVAVYTRPVERKGIVQAVSASGKVQPVVKVEISAYVSAEITQLPVQEGQAVKAGDLLVELDSTRYRATRDGISASVTAAQSQLKIARVNLEQARRENERVQSLHSQGLISRAEVELSQTKLDAQRSVVRASEDDVHRAAAQLRLAGDDIAKTVLKSPIDGVIIALTKEAGEMVVGSGFTRDIIMTVADLSVMEVLVEVDENDVPHVKLGQRAVVTVDAFPKDRLEGTVTAIANSAKTKGLGTQEETTNFAVSVRLQAPRADVRPGMSATAEIVTASKDDVLSVPIQCLTMRDPDADPKQSVGMMRADKLREVVFLVENNRAVLLPVETGISSDFDMEVTGALESGMQLICGPFNVLNKDLHPGDLLHVKDEAAMMAGKVP
ncbi:MAG: efflux RND transporter periplasmic adaptor subunit [Polyangiaceae bacterium]|nr:efflux RND transporter periplasmic adaptor subunit [Polyangiaceae bacterium]